MTTEEAKIKFNSLSQQEQKTINKLVNEVKQYGANVFFIETGGQVDKAGYWELVRFVLVNL